MGKGSRPAAYSGQDTTVGRRRAKYLTYIRPEPSAPSPQEASWQLQWPSPVFNNGNHSVSASPLSGNIGHHPDILLDRESAPRHQGGDYLSHGGTSLHWNITAPSGDCCRPSGAIQHMSIPANLVDFPLRPSHGSTMLERFRMEAVQVG